MKINIMAAALASLMVLAMGCGKKEKDESSYKTIETQGKQYQLFAKVNKLRVRKVPDLKAAAFMTIAKGDRVTYLNRKSVKKFPVTLRGKKYNEPMLKVKLADGESGWIYGGALSKTPVKPDNKVYTVKNIEQGDIMCYLTLADENGKTVQMGATFQLCESRSEFINRKIVIAGTEVVNVNDCESNEPCGKTRKETLVTGMNFAD